MNLLKPSILTAALLLSGCAALQPKPTSWEGLQRVDSRNFDEVYLLEAARFEGYRRVALDPAQVTFERDWLRQVNAERGAFRLGSEDAAKIAADMSERFNREFAEELKRRGWEVTTDTDADVLRLTPVLMNVYVVVPPDDLPVRQRVYSLSAGRATLALEARDAISGQLLGRAVDRRETRTDDRFEWTTSVTIRAEFDRLFKRWAGTAAKGLDQLTARYGR